MERFDPAAATVTWKDPASGETFSPAQLAPIKTEVKQKLEAAWAWLQADADARLK